MSIEIREKKNPFLFPWEKAIVKYLYGDHSYYVVATGMYYEPHVKLWYLFLRIALMIISLILPFIGAELYNEYKTIIPMIISWPLMARIWWFMGVGANDEF
jgi:hypothetical protein